MMHKSTVTIVKVFSDQSIQGAPKSYEFWYLSLLSGHC